MTWVFWAGVLVGAAGAMVLAGVGGVLARVAGRSPTIRRLRGERARLDMRVRAYDARGRVLVDRRLSAGGFPSRRLHVEFTEIAVGRGA